MKIKELARKLNMTPRAIRLYEKAGLLSPERDPGNGYRQYTERDAWKLQTIAALRDMGFGVKPIRDLLDRYERGESAAIHRFLEIQRMAMVAKWVEWKHAIATVDELIGKMERQGALPVDELFRLAGDLRHIRTSHAAWRDRWNFDRLAPDFDAASAAYAIGPSANEEVYRGTLLAVAQLIAAKPGEHGLDVGTGTGNLAGMLLSAGAIMDAVDQSNAMLAQCRAKHPGVTAKLGNALSLPYVESRFHFIVSAFALHHLDAAQQKLALEEMHRVLRPRGRICIAGLMNDGAAAGSAAAAGTDRFPSDLSALIGWFRERRYTTFRHRVSDDIQIVYAIHLYEEE